MQRGFKRFLEPFEDHQVDSSASLVLKSNAERTCKVSSRTVLNLTSSSLSSGKGLAKQNAGSRINILCVACNNDANLLASASSTVKRNASSTGLTSSSVCTLDNGKGTSSASRRSVEHYDITSGNCTTG
jgi:hypothetical protein